jgi:hypothetical protein
MFHRLFLGTLLLVTFMSVRTSAQSCRAPAIMLTIDRSSSMLGRLPDGTTKWDAAVTAIAEITAAYERQIDFGLQPFPFPDRCEPGPVLLEMGPHTSTEMLEALGIPPPSGGNYTPMAETLNLAAEHPGLLDPARTRHLVLITDGWQWCDPHMPANRFTPIAAVMRLRELGITVHVVGFGAAVDALTLNRAAVAAGTALAGCDPDLSSARESNHCYLQSNNLAELRVALAEIGKLVTDETCDGEDNDCDGAIDEGFDLDGDGFSRCMLEGADTPRDCNDANERVHPGALEVCDGIDNDCDETIDADCRCVEGAEMPCGSDVGACVAGVQHCVLGRFGACEEAVGPQTETCDGVDQDCDGTIDEHADESCEAGWACTIEGCIELMAVPPDASMAVPTPQPEEEARAPRRRGTHDGCACTAVGAARGSRSAAMLFFAIGAGFIGCARRRKRARHTSVSPRNWTPRASM